MATGYTAEVSHKTNAIPRNVGLQPTRSGIISMRGQSMEVNAADVVDRLQQVYGVTTDVAIAAALGLSKNAPGNWRNRNATPFEICATVAARRGISLDWLLFGVGSMERAPSGADTTHPVHPLSAPAQRITQFVCHWDAARSVDENVWLEQQLKRAVPEYSEWLSSQPGPHVGN